MIPGGLGERLESLRVFGPSGPRPGSGGFARLASLRLAAARLAAGFLHPLLRLLRHWRGGGNILIWIFQIRNGCRRLLIWIFQIRPRGRSGFNRPPGKRGSPECAAREILHRLGKVDMPKPHQEINCVACTAAGEAFPMTGAHAKARVMIFVERTLTHPPIARPFQWPVNRRISARCGVGRYARRLSYAPQLLAPKLPRPRER